MICYGSVDADIIQVPLYAFQPTENTVQKVTACHQLDPHFMGNEGLDEHYTSQVCSGIQFHTVLRASLRSVVELNVTQHSFVRFPQVANISIFLIVKNNEVSVWLFWTVFGQEPKHMIKRYIYKNLKMAEDAGAPWKQKEMVSFRRETRWPWGREGKKSTQLVSVSSKLYESECWSYNGQRQSDLALV